MSEENVELLREMYGGWRGQWVQTSLAQLGESLHPQAELHQAREIPDAEDYYGRGEFLRGMRRWLEDWDDFRYLPEEVIDLGERAFMRVRVSGRARTSGIELDLDAFHLWTFRDGMPWRCEVFLDEKTARAAARLSE